jgi:hypothetical protein
MEFIYYGCLYSILNVAELEIGIDLGFKKGMFKLTGHPVTVTVTGVPTSP